MKARPTPQKVMLSKLAEIQARHPGYSLRAFSKRLGMSPATVSMVLSGKRKLSRKAALKITRVLTLDPQETSEFLAFFPETRAPGTGAENGPVYSQLTADQFRAMSEWYYFAILSLMKTQGFSSDPKWIGERLGIPPSQAAQAIETMKRLGVLVQADDGGLVRTQERLRSTDDIVDLSLRKAHFQNLELAHKSLERDDVERRDFSSLTVALHPSKMREAKALIRRFQDEFDALVEVADPAPTEVYRLFVQLFPLTQSERKPT